MLTHPATPDAIRIQFHIWFQFTLNDFIVIFSQASTKIWFWAWNSPTCHGQWLSRMSSAALCGWPDIDIIYEHKTTPLVRCPTPFGTRWGQPTKGSRLWHAKDFYLTGPKVCIALYLRVQSEKWWLFILTIFRLKAMMKKERPAE